MEIDDFLELNPNANIEGVFLKDAIFFKCDNQFYSDNDKIKLKNQMDVFLKHYHDAAKWSKPKDQYGNTKIFSMEDAARAAYKLKEKEIGHFDFVKYWPPYTNIILKINIPLEEKIIYKIFWIVFKKNFHEIDGNIYNRWAFCILDRFILKTIETSDGETREWYVNDYKLSLYERGFIDLADTFLMTLNSNPVPFTYLLKTFFIQCLYYIIKFCSILNCKNISTEKNYPPKALNKKRIKQGKQPLFTYHTLVVNPMSEKKRSNSEHEQTGIKQRLHFCRGHFKEYTEQNKLFGKHTGLYWWQPMVRGNKELGIVHKDYLVKTA